MKVKLNGVSITLCHHYQVVVIQMFNFIITDFHSPMFCQTEVSKNNNKKIYEKNKDRDEIRGMCVKGFEFHNCNSL